MFECPFDSQICQGFSHRFLDIFDALVYAWSGGRWHFEPPVLHVGATQTRLVLRMGGAHPNICLGAQWWTKPGTDQLEPKARTFGTEGWEKADQNGSTGWSPVWKCWAVSSDPGLGSLMFEPTQEVRGSHSNHLWELGTPHSTRSSV